MSRIGKQPVTLPSSTTVTLTGDSIQVHGPKGDLTVTLPEGIHLVVADGVATLTREDDRFRAAHGLVRALLQNAVTGVSEGWQRQLEMNGVGIRAAVSGSDLNLNLGFSHPVSVAAPAGIGFAVQKNVITVSGIDKQQVGEIAAQIRKLRAPEPYKGKGIKYSDEKIRRKAGKSGKSAK